ncbi:MAG: YjfB family protein [Anaerolineaceae bacterium]|nr:YjfB family protein [Anaerolineaceae bacterium]
MGVGAVSDINSQLIQQATSMAGGRVQQEISSAVLKGILDQQKTAGQAIVQMIQNSSSLTGTGRVIDIRA